MKKLVSLLCIMVLAISMLSGCSKKKDNEPASTNTPQSETNTGDDSTPAPTSAETTTAEPRVLTWINDATDGWVRNFNPLAADVKSWALGFMFEPLVIFNTYQNNEETMWLAEDVISEPDNVTITIKVRKGVKWSDGEDFTADDVYFTYTYDKKYPEIDRNGNWDSVAADGTVLKGKFKDVVKVDDYTVQIIMNEPNRFARNDVLLTRWMLPEHIFKDVTNPASYVMETPVVTGAFSEVLSFTPEMILLGRNPYFWNGDNLQVDQMKIPQHNGNEAATALLQTGEIDWTHIMIADIENTYVQGDAHKKYWYGMNDGVRLAFNYMTPNKDNLKAFQTPDFKRALSMAIDRQGIIDSAVYGYLQSNVPSNTGLPPALFGYMSDKAQAEMAKYTTYDMEGAKALLTKAGFVDVDGDGFVENPDGSKIAFEILSPAGWTDWNDGSAIVAQNWQDIGVNATAKAIDLSLIQETWATGEHDVLYSGYGATANIWKFYYDTIGNQANVKQSNWWTLTQTNYVSDELTALIAEMPTASDARVKEITEAVEMYYAENMINIPLFFNGNWYVYSDARWTGWATAENPFVNPAICNHDMKILQLMALKPVE